MVATTFRSLRGRNYRVWAAGSLVSNIGTWMQRIAQDWLVLTQLTHNNATAVGIVTALQFAPQVVLLPLTGYAADHLDRRKLLLVTQSAMGLLALGLGLLTLAGKVQLVHVYGFALLLGCVTAFDAPARQTFVSELVAEVDLSNAVALNSTSFNAARMIGPALAGVLIAGVGSAWAFLLNAVSFGAVIASLLALRVEELRTRERRPGRRGGFADGFRYVRGRPDLLALFAMYFLVGTLGLNFAIYISTMSVVAFHAGAGEYGLLTSLVAVGSVAGALLSASREKPRLELLAVGSGILAAGFALAALVPSFWIFGCALVVVGIAAQTFTTSANATVQLSTEPHMRGRVLAILLAVALGGLAVGGPIAGAIADAFGPRAALGVASAAGLAATLVGLLALRVRPPRAPA